MQKTIITCSGAASRWSSEKCVRFGAGRSRVRLSAGSYQDLVNWFCSLLTRRTVCGRAAGNSPRTQKKQVNWNQKLYKLSRGGKTTAVIKRQQTNHHIKQCLGASQPVAFNNYVTAQRCFKQYIFNNQPHSINHYVYFWKILVKVLFFWRNMTLLFLFVCLYMPVWLLSSTSN